MPELTAIISHPCDETVEVREEVKTKIANWGGDPQQIVVITAMSDGKVWTQDAAFDLWGLVHALSFLKASDTTINPSAMEQLWNILYNHAQDDVPKDKLAKAILSIVHTDEFERSLQGR